MQQTLLLPNGEEIIEVAVSSDILGEIVDPQDVCAPEDQDRVVARALQEPIDSPRLSSLARPEHKVALIIDDITRLTPTRRMLPHVLDELRLAGVPDESVYIVIALGTHRPMTDAEMDLKIGRELAARFNIVNIPAHNDEHMLYMGESQGGIPIWVNKTVASADLRIGLGMIVPHMDAGFGGGSKIILPGVCGERTVQAFHAQMAYIEGNQLGRSDAPLRADLEAFVAAHVPLHMIVNVVLDASGKIYACVAGHPKHAHRQGVRHALEVYGSPVSRKYPVVLACAHPYGIDFWQATKALASAALMTEKGGTIILHAECPEGFGPHPLLPVYAAMPPSAVQGLIATRQAEDPTAAGVAVTLRHILHGLRLCLVSGGIPPELAAAHGYGHFTSIGEALARTISNHGGKKRKVLGVLRHGGVTIPLVNNAVKKTE